MKPFATSAWRLAACAALALAAACGDDPASHRRPASDGTVDRGGTAVIAEAADMSQPLPLLATTTLDGSLVDIMYMGLLRGIWRDGRFTHVAAPESPMALARGYEFVGPDSTTLRFHLHPGVQWSDGVLVTAHDVVWTYRMLADPALASPRQDWTTRIDSVVAESDTTVAFHFQRRYPEMLEHSAHPIAPAHVYDDAEAKRLREHPGILAPGGGNLVVSGPFQVERWDQGQQIVLRPNPHFQPRPNLDRIVIRVIPDPTARLVELQTGTADFVPAVPFDQVPRLLSETPGLRVEREEKRFYDYIAYNPSAHPAFADPDTRRALGLGINVPGIIGALRMGEYASPAGGPYPPILPRVHDPAQTPPLPYDPQQARRILEAHGWKDTDGDGVREKDGQPLRFTLLTNAGNQRRLDAAQIIQRQWREIGVDARVQQMEWNAMAERLIQKEYAAALAGWGVALSPDLVGTWGQDTPFNITGYQNPRVSALFRKALEQPTEEAAAPYWKRAAAEIVEDQPYTWLYFYDVVNVVSDRLRDTRIDPVGPYQNVWEWWIPASRQRKPRTSTGAATR